MASSRDRQRKLARAKLDRQLARRAAAARRKRQVRAGVGSAVALLLIVFGSIWAFGGFDREPAEPTVMDICAWTTQSTEANSNLKDVGTPPTSGMPTSGTRPMTITTNQGAPIVVELDLTNAPCAAASFTHLAGQSFFDNTKCHEITAEGAVRCGDPSGTGMGGPSYTFINENLPQVPTPAPSDSPSPGASASASASPSPSPSATSDQAPLYPAGTVAMIGNPPGANGSQFLIFFKDFTTTNPSYPIVGRVTSGMDVVKKIGAMETVDNGSGEKVKPKNDVVVQSLTVGEPNSAGSTTTASPSATPSASASPSASGSPSASATAAGQS